MDASKFVSALAANKNALTIAERDYKKAQAEADKWESLYQRALKAGNDETSLKEIQFYKEVLAKKASKLKAMLDEQKERVANLESKFNPALISRLIEKNVNQLPHTSESITKLSDADLETRIRKLESNLENMKSQLLQQQTAIAQMIKLNAIALAEVKDILKQNYSSQMEVADAGIKIKYVTIESDCDLDVDDELIKMKEQLVGKISKEVTSNPHEQTNPQSSSYSSGSAVEKDLEEMRKQIDML